MNRRTKQSRRLSLTKQQSDDGPCQYSSLSSTCSSSLGDSNHSTVALLPTKTKTTNTSRTGRRTPLTTITKNLRRRKQHEQKSLESRERRIIVKESVSSWLDDAMVKVSTSLKKQQKRRKHVVPEKESTKSHVYDTLSDVEEDFVETDDSSLAFHMELQPEDIIISPRKSQFVTLSSSSAGIDHLQLSIPFKEI